MRFYEVHRGSSPSFDPAESTFVGRTVDQRVADPDVARGSRSFYRVRAVDFAGNAGGASEAAAVTAAGEGGSLPENWSLDVLPGKQGAGSVTFRIGLPERARVGVSLYGPDGRRVASWPEGIGGPGYRAVAWQGRDGTGRDAGRGVYIVRVEARAESGARFVTTRKVVWLR